MSVIGILPCLNMLYVNLALILSKSPFKIFALKVILIVIPSTYYIFINSIYVIIIIILFLMLSYK